MKSKIRGTKCRIAKLDVFQQLKASRRLLPVLAGLVSDFGTLKPMMVRGSRGKLAFDGGRVSDALDIVPPEIADTLATLSEEDANAVIRPCLSVVIYQHEKGWVKTFDWGTLIFGDIDLSTIL